MAAMAAMLTRLGCSNPARASLGGQGLDSINTLADTGEDVIANMCKIIRRDEQVPISAIAESNIKLASFVARHHRRISRVMTPAGTTMAVLRRYRELYEEEKAYEVPDNNIELDMKDWAKNIDSIKDYLGIRLGRTKIPLAYIVRKEVVVPPAADDPQDDYITHQDEMIARASHDVATNEAYPYDNRMVWDLIAGWVRDTECWIHVKPFQRRRDGRGAYLAIYNHYLGVNTVNNQARAAEARLNKLEYKSEGRRWGLEKYIQQFKKQYEILRNLEEMDGSTYSAPDEGTMVRKFIDGVKNSSFDACKTQVMSQPEMGTDLERVFNLYKDFLSQSKASNTTLNVSRVGTSTGSGSGSGSKRSRDGSRDGNVPEHVWKKAHVEDKFYIGKQYNKLSKAQKAKLQWLRSQRSKDDSNKKHKTGNGSSLVAALATQMENMVETMDSVQKAVSKMRKTQKATAGNRDHPALTPRGSKKKKSVTFHEESSSSSESE